MAAGFAGASHSETLQGVILNTYRAFLSYSHHDGLLVRKLHRRLEEFELPARLRRGSARRPCAPVYRDRDEMGAEPFLKQSIAAALDVSERLVVVCTRHSAKSLWVELEIDRFLSKQPTRPIIAFVPEGDSGTLTSFLPPAFLALKNRGELDLVDASPLGLGFEGGVAALLSRMTSLDPVQVQQLDTRRRRRTLAVTSAVRTVAAMLATISVFMLLVALQGVISSSLSAISGYREVEAGIREMWQVAGQPGPLVSLNQEIWKSLSQRMRSTFIYSSATSAVPGARKYQQLAYIATILERSSMELTSGDQQEALLLAKVGRGLTDQFLEQQMGPLDRLILKLAPWNFSGLQFRLDQRSWFILSQAQAGSGEVGPALQSGLAALKAGTQVLRLENAEDADRVQNAMIAMKLAAFSIESNEGQFTWREGFSAAITTIEALPSSGMTQGREEWQVVRAGMLAQASAYEAATAGRWDDTERARQAIDRAEATLQFLKSKGFDAKQEAILQTSLNSSRSSLARNANDWRKIAEIAEAIQPLLAALDLSAMRPGTYELLAADNFLALSKARQKLGEEYRPFLKAGLAQGRVATAPVPNDPFYRSMMAGLLSTATKIETSAGECRAAQELRRQTEIEIAGISNNEIARPLRKSLEGIERCACAAPECR
jgi:hypothetical protein